MVIVSARTARFAKGPAILTHIDAAEEKWLAETAKDRRVLEVGSAAGFSAILMARAGARKVVTVDCHAGENPGSEEALRKNIAAYRVRDRVKAVTAYSSDYLPELVAAGQEFDLVFLDGDHSAHATGEAAELGWRLVAPGGVLACHDYGFEPFCPGVQEALDRLWPDGPDERVESLWIKHKPSAVVGAEDLPDSAAG